MTNKRIQLYTVPEVAELLRTNADTIRRWCRAGDLPGVVQHGARGAWLIPDTAIQQWIKNNTYYPTASKENRDDRA